MIYTHSIFYKIFYCSDMLGDYTYGRTYRLKYINVLTNGCAVHKVIKRKKKERKKEKK